MAFHWRGRVEWAGLLWPLFAGCGALSGADESAAPPASRIAASYSVVVIPTPPDIWGSPAAINDHGEVVGSYCIEDPLSVVYTWTLEGGRVDHTQPDGRAWAMDMNDAGVFIAMEGGSCGWYDWENLPRAASNLGGGYSVLPAPEGATAYLAGGINDDNVIVGNSLAGSYGSWRFKDSNYEFFEDLGALDFWPTAINAAGVVAGCGSDHVPVFDGQSVAEWPSLGGHACAQDINGAGLVVGWSELSNDETSRPFLSRDGVTVDLIPPDWPGDYPWASAAAVNDGGIVVGYAPAATGPYAYTGFAWSEEDGFVDLSTRVGDSGWLIYNATGINNRGQIVAEAIGGRGNTQVVLIPDP